MHSVYARYFLDEEIAKGEIEMPETFKDFFLEFQGYK